MTKPVAFKCVQRTNENFEVTIPLPWVASQWPLPDGSYFQSDIRERRDSAAELVTFASNSNPQSLSPPPISWVWDANRSTLHLTLFAPQSAIAALWTKPPCVMDIRLVRPRAGAQDRIDIVADGDVIFLEGITRD